MRCGVIARKLGMSRIFNDNGEHVPVTILRMENVEVLSTKSVKKDGYTAVQLGFCNTKSKNISKPLKGVFAKSKSLPKEKIAEFRVSEDAILKVGDKLSVNHLVVGHNFGGMQATHGVSISHRSHGSTGNSQDPGRTWKGKKMAGHYGNARITTQNLKVIKLFEEDSLILIQGSVPGTKNGIVLLRDAIKYKTPESAPFPAGLQINEKIKNEGSSSKNIDDKEETSSDLEGDEVEN